MAVLYSLWSRKSKRHKWEYEYGSYGKREVFDRYERWGLTMDDPKNAGNWPKGFQIGVYHNEEEHHGPPRSVEELTRLPANAVMDAWRMYWPD